MKPLRYLLFCLTMTTSAFPQTTNAPAETFLAKLAGEWTGTGRCMGKPVTYASTGTAVAPPLWETIRETTTN